MSCMFNIKHMDLLNKKQYHIDFNLQHSLGKFSRWQIGDIFLIFPRKQDLIFHANCLHWIIYQIQKGAKSFLLESSPFQMEKTVLTELPPLKVYPLSLTLCMLGKISVDGILKYFSKKIGFDTLCKLGDNLHKVSNPIFLEKLEKFHQSVVCWICINDLQHEIMVSNDAQISMHILHILITVLLSSYRITGYNGIYWQTMKGCFVAEKLEHTHILVSSKIQSI